MDFTSSSQLTIQANTIHLWTINPQHVNDPQKLSYYREILNETELSKVDSYKLPQARHDALITRAFIRLLLSQYVPINPKDWSFIITKNGKPELDNPLLPIRFNLSHNKELIVCALCLEDDIGCDVENLGRKISYSAIIKRYFSANEQKSINALPNTSQHTHFINYWTLKEAFVKATGHGISLGLNTFSFKINPSDLSNFNDNIELDINDNCKVKNRKYWYNCLIYPDDEHCIAISVCSPNKTASYNIQYFCAANSIF